MKLEGLAWTAWELYWRIQALGWDMVKTLLDLELTTAEADQILGLVAFITDYETQVAKAYAARNQGR